MRRESRKTKISMETMTLHIPAAQVGWFEQMVRTMGWTIEKGSTNEQDTNRITPAMQRSINKARKELVQGQTISCHSPQDMQQYFDSL